MLPVAAIALSLAACGDDDIDNAASRNLRSEEHTSELQSRI